MDENFERQKQNLLRGKAEAEKRLAKAVAKYEQIQASSVDRKEARLRLATSEITLRKKALQKIEEQIEFARPKDAKDMEYRSKQYDQFPDLIKQIVPDDLPLRFHGCPITAAKHIIEDGEISSSVDRLGVATSYDVEDQVSVTTKKTVETTVKGYAGLVGNETMPAGCIFVILPRDEADARSGESMLMGNISFRENSERLVSIISTPENLPRLTQWLEESGIDVSKLCDYDGFQALLEQYLEKRNGIDLLQSAIEATKEQVRTGSINQQVGQIKESQREDKAKETEEFEK